ncbi:hypothetical protein LP52_06630 [Streptomonospora alba]|uniref:3'-5' exonuclease n=1 Tax=Streptomonospora alba TaxID=183763 RepID=A0A0C2G899_9ACTN|nr:hypothetical protein LP52_06630 [Streptomonospora alba]
MTEQPWTQAPLVALDLEGTGAQDRENEAILEIAAVPLAWSRKATPHTSADARWKRFQVNQGWSALGRAVGDR